MPYGRGCCALAYFPTTLEISGTIHNSRRHKHRCIFWQPIMIRTIPNPEVVSNIKFKQVMINPTGPAADTVPCKLYNEQGHATAASLGGIYQGWLLMCLIKASLGDRKENRDPYDSLSVVSRKCDDFSALWYCKEEHFKLVGVMILLCLIQVFHYEATSKFVCYVIIWNQEYTCEIVP
jgi:hypothetical protein